MIHAVPSSWMPSLAFGYLDLDFGFWIGVKSFFDKYFSLLYTRKYVPTFTH